MVGLLSPFQSGFTQHHSTESAVIYFTDEIRVSAELGKLTGALFIDLRKAFDSVPHNELLSKLKRFALEKIQLIGLQAFYLTDFKLSPWITSCRVHSCPKWSALREYPWSGFIYAVY